MRVWRGAVALNSRASRTHGSAYELSRNHPGQQFLGNCLLMKALSPQGLAGLFGTWASLLSTWSCMIQQQGNSQERFWILSGHPGHFRHFINVEGWRCCFRHFPRLVSIETAPVTSRKCFSGRIKQRLKGGKVLCIKTIKLIASPCAWLGSPNSPAAWSLITCLYNLPEGRQAVSESGKERMMADYA